jgi:ZIP family zinc transporter
LPLGVSALLSATATGILVFLLWDVLSAGIEPVEGALHAAALDHDGTWLRFVGLATVFATCFGVGLMSLVYFDGIVAGRRRRGGFRSVGAAAVAETDIRPGALSPAQSLSLLIATGIGLHNFSEGLAIGQSAASGELSLALVLVIGFGLHNATEGFGIVGPFSGGEERPSWGFLGLVGLVGGAPTFFGTLLGQTWVSEPVSIAFLALAAGSLAFDSIGSAIVKLQGANDPSVPPFVGLAARTRHTPWSDPGQPGFLGPSYSPFKPDGPGMANLKLNRISLAQLTDRRKLLSSFDGMRREIDANGMSYGMDAAVELALAGQRRHRGGHGIAGLVFAGDGDGNIMAFESRTGKNLWHYQLGFPMRSTAGTTYMLDGRQYLLVPAAGTAGGGRGGASAVSGAAAPLGWVAYALPMR